MDLSNFLIIAAGVLAAGLTGFLWVRVRQLVHTEEHPVLEFPRADRDDSRRAWPAA